MRQVTVEITNYQDDELHRYARKWHVSRDVALRRILTKALREEARDELFELCERKMAENAAMESRV